MGVAIAYVALGSNLSDPAMQVRNALIELGRIEATQLIAHSRLFRSPPWGKPGQPEFVNAVARLRTSLEPRALLNAMLAIEAAAGRIRMERWGPRILDLDLLLFADRIIDEPGLHVPHPRLSERAFVLLPLADIAPTLQIDGMGSVAELAGKVDCSGVEALG
jgi:2-amino-4-hydroxy-6-hydroxymethyldihydropteridine diphosphokinase